MTAQRVLDLARKALRTAVAALIAAAVCVSPSVAQEPVRDGPDALSAARRLLAAGTPALALLRIERSQLAESPRWADWEALRLAALAGLGRWQDLTARAEALPTSSTLPAPFLRAAWLAGAEAALRLVDTAATASVTGPAAGKGSTPVPDGALAAARARALAARVIWSTSPSADEIRRAQVVVIESLFDGGDASSGYRSILRYRQDQPSPPPAVSARFLALMAAHGMAAESLPLLPLLSDSDAVRIAVQMRLGLLTPPTAAARARAAVQRPAMPGVVAAAAREWQLLRSACQANGDVLCLVGASERALDADPMATSAAEAARMLWRDYLSAAPAVANREQLLVGDVFGWSDAAARMAGRDPLAARVLFAQLALHAPEPDLRASARLQLAWLLREAGLGGAAARLFLDREAFDPALHAADLRRLLGEAAAARRLHALAADFRRGLTSRPGEDVDDFRIAGAEVQARAALLADALQSVLAVFTGPRTAAPQPALVARVHALADLFVDAGEAAAAARIREVAGPVPTRRP